MTAWTTTTTAARRNPHEPASRGVISGSAEPAGERPRRMEPGTRLRGRACSGGAGAARRREQRSYDGTGRERNARHRLRGSSRPEPAAGPDRHGTRRSRRHGGGAAAAGGRRARARGAAGCRAARRARRRRRRRLRMRRSGPGCRRRARRSVGFGLAAWPGCRLADTSLGAWHDRTDPLRGGPAEQQLPCPPSPVRPARRSALPTSPRAGRRAAPTPARPSPGQRRRSGEANAQRMRVEPGRRPSRRTVPAASITPSCTSSAGTSSRPCAPGTQAYCQYVASKSAIAATRSNVISPAYADARRDDREAAAAG